MGLYLRKSKKIAPGVRLNASKHGFSLSVGPRGAKVNISKRGTYLSTSVPGTGVYARKKISSGSPKSGLTREEKMAIAQQKMESRSASENLAWTVVFGILVAAMFIISIVSFISGKIALGVIMILFGLFMLIPTNMYYKQYIKKKKEESETNDESEENEIPEKYVRLVEQLNSYCDAMYDAKTLEDLISNNAMAKTVVQELIGTPVLLSGEKPEDVLVTLDEYYEKNKLKFL